MNQTDIFPSACHRWGIYELAFSGKTSGNPYLQYRITGTFCGEQETVTLDGFYDGDGIYRIRFMPSYEGLYTFSVSGSFSKQAYHGSFTSLPAVPGCHGPVRVADTYHFRYADGTPYRPVGTTCYAWTFQKGSVRTQTLATMAGTCFNKLRFCLFPKHYDYNLNDPVCFPFEGTPCDNAGLTEENFSQANCSCLGGREIAAKTNHWDFERFNPEYFRLLEDCILKLAKAGIEADLILFHPYDRWGFSDMTPEQDERYVRYIAARFSAYHNVWWAMANEYDLMPQKTFEDWERLGRLVKSLDPYGHLLSIHNCQAFYDHTRDFITHCSIQRTDLYLSSEMTEKWREQYKKPVVLDEICYEGNLQHGWGNLTGKELTRRCWEAVCRGGYPGHGETFLERIPDGSAKDRDVRIWWSHGGTLYGECPPRLAFLSQVLADIPGGHGLKSIHLNWDEVAAVPDSPLAEEHSYYLVYFSFMAPLFRRFHMDDETWFEIDILDTWNMTVTHLGKRRGEFTVPLPGKPYMALRLKKAERSHCDDAS